MWAPLRAVRAEITWRIRCTLYLLSPPTLLLYTPHPLQALLLAVRTMCASFLASSPNPI